MAVQGSWPRYWRVSTEASFAAATPGTKAEWILGGNGGGANGWMDFPVNRDQDGLQPKSTLVFPNVAGGVRAMNTADPVAGAYDPALGALTVPVYPELFDRVLYSIMGGVQRAETAGSAAKASTAFASLADLDTQPNGTEQLKFTIAASTAASSAAINIIQNGATVETITIGSNAGTVNGVYYSKGAYNGSINAITFSVAGTVTDGTVVVAGVDLTTSTFTQGNTNPSLAIEQGGRQEAGSGNSEFFHGVIVPQCQLTWDRATVDSMLMANLTLQGLFSGAATKTTYANDTDKYYKPLMAWHCTATLDAVTTTELVAVSLNLNNNNELYAVQAGSQNPTGQVPGEFEVFGELTVLPADATLWTAYRNATNKTLVLNFQTPFYIVDTTPYQLQFTMTRVFFGDYTRNRQNQAQGATIPFRAIYNSTDSGAVKIVKKDRMPI
jgi:hypothetical protein